MPYDYRKMTPEEREEVTRIRRENGYPIHNPPHPIRVEGYYLITAACFEHAPLLQSIQRRTEFEIRLLSAMRSANINVTAWVVLPNHYHALVFPPQFDELSQVIKHLHGTTSFEWNEQDHCREKRKVWFHYTDRYIRSEAHLFQAMNYIHYNPVKHGYVETPYDWRWSSLELYYEGKGRDWLRKQWRKYPPLANFED